MTTAKARGIKFKPDQEHIVRRLGAALIIHWDDLPDALQDSLIDQAVLMAEFDEAAPSREDVETLVRTAKVRDVAPSPPA